MTLGDAIIEAISANRPSDDDGTVFCLQHPKQCTPDFLCLIVFGEDATVLQRDGQTWYYFLEASIMQELYEDTVPTTVPSELAERVERVLYYARYDA